MRKAILYTRVSTTEQKEQGFSLLDQETRLRQYCELQDIEVLAHFQDDHSAKTFDRPKFKQLLIFAKDNKQKIDYLLFLKWDRFSRNAGDSYAMIKKLDGYNIECQATEQLLDLNVPENKMMLAIYLSTGEVENARRSINVTQGMRRANKEGRFIALAPKGYANKRDEDNRPIIQPNKDAQIIVEAFEQMATGSYTAQQIRKELLTKNDIKCSKSAFSMMMRNPVYIGKVIVKAYKDEPEELLEGIHEPLISESLYYKVQNVLTGRVKEKNAPKVHTKRSELPLRGFLQCNLCGSKLTGSASRNRYGTRYYYYHCINGCKERYRADEVNTKFEDMLQEIALKSEIKQYYLKVIEGLLKSGNGDTKTQIKQLEAEIKRQEDRISNLQDKLADDLIDAHDFVDMKKRYERTINNNRLQISELKLNKGEFKEYLEFALPFLENLGAHYKTADIDTKQRIISSIFTDFLVYNGKGLRTFKINEAVRLITLNASGLGVNKKGQLTSLNGLSRRVIAAGFEPVTVSLEVQTVLRYFEIASKSSIIEGQK